MAWDDCGIYGNPNLPTPNIDRLGYEVCALTEHFSPLVPAVPVASIITGLYPHSTDAEQLQWELPAAKSLL